MAEKEIKQDIEALPEEIGKIDILAEKKEQKEYTGEKVYLDSWVPKTKLGRSVKEGKEKDIDKIIKSGKKILEPEIVESLISLESELLMIGQAKGKFGGGKRRAWRQTQKKTQEGNIITFSTMAVVGDKNGHIGIGYGRAKETLPAREKAIRNAKLNITKIERGFESPESEEEKNNPHTVPFKVQGKCGSVKLTLLPAPRGTGLVIGDECKKILRLAGIKDVYSQTRGKTKTTFNMAKACMNALINTTKINL
ncbi:MAG: 30S ribosomal protein S5 [Nanoarchaeota archaeon]